MPSDHHVLGPLDGAPIEVHRYCSKENVEVPYEEITHGYECEDGEQVIVADLELEAIEPRKTRTIDIEQFVDLENVIRSTRARRSRAQDGQGAPTGGRI